MKHTTWPVLGVNGRAGRSPPDRAAECNLNEGISQCHVAAPFRGPAEDGGRSCWRLVRADGTRIVPPLTVTEGAPEWHPIHHGGELQSREGRRGVRLQQTRYRRATDGNRGRRVETNISLLNSWIFIIPSTVFHTKVIVSVVNKYDQVNAW